MAVLQLFSGDQHTSNPGEPFLGGALDFLTVGGSLGPIIDVSATTGSSYIVGSESGDVIVTGSGADAVDGAAGDDVILGGDGDDFLSGAPGHDRIHGGSGSDIILGGADGDTLYGGHDEAFDRLIGGTEPAVRDVFRIDSIDRDPMESTNGRYDTVENFEAGIDVIDLSGARVTSMGELMVSDLGPDVLVTARTDGSTFLILGQTAADLDASWFAFADGA